MPPRKAEVADAIDLESMRLDLVPLIDVCFNTIIFFVMCSEMGALSINAGITLPVIDRAETKPPPGILIVNMLNKPGSNNLDADIQVAGDTMDFAGLNKHLILEASQAGEETPEGAAPGLLASKLTVVLRGDKALSFRFVYIFYQICMGTCPKFKSNPVKPPIYKVKLGCGPRDPALGPVVDELVR